MCVNAFQGFSFFVQFLRLGLRHFTFILFILVKWDQYNKWPMHSQWRYIKGISYFQVTLNLNFVSYYN